VNEDKYRQVTRILRSRILREVYKDRLPGEVELAKELGVGESTLALALSSLETAGLVRRKRRLGTFVVPKEERAKAFAPMTVVLIATLGSVATVTSAFAEAAQAHGLETVLLMHAYEDLDKVVEDALLRLRNVACIGGCVFDHPIDSPHAMSLAAAPGAVVLADWETPDLILPTITYDDREAGRMSAAHLLKLGHRHIALLDPLPEDVTRRTRADGAAELVRQSGGTYLERFAPKIDWGVPSCLAALRGEHFTAAICGTHSTAVDLKAAAESLGRKVPQDLSILCMGNIASLSPAEDFTFIRFDEAALGTGALELIIESKPAEEPRRKVIPVHLRDKGSTAPPTAEPR
jgi:DNA-binding LacI/PurR family transcriptional regulator